ncbi:unnamed protein product [Rotaria socialis]
MCASFNKLFSAPTDRERARALGDTYQLPDSIRRAVTIGVDECFLPFPIPNEGDWVTMNQERGQTVESFERTKQTVLHGNRRTIYIQPIGSFDHPRVPSLKNISEFSSHFFPGCRLETLPQIDFTDLPKHSRAGQRIDPYTKKPQYSATLIIDHLKKMKRRQRKNDTEELFCIGVTMADIYPDSSWNFVYGLASTIDGIAIYSFARLDPSFPDIESVGPCTEQERILILKRAISVCVHEIIHLFGLKHCVYYLCLMNGAETEVEMDGQPLYLCPICLRKMYTATGKDRKIFNVVETYHDILDVCQKFHFKDEAACSNNSSSSSFFFIQGSSHGIVDLVLLRGLVPHHQQLRSIQLYMVHFESLNPIIVAKAHGFQAIVTANTGSVAQQLIKYVFKYGEDLVVLLTAYRDPSGGLIFSHADPNLRTTIKISNNHNETSLKPSSFLQPLRKKMPIRRNRSKLMSPTTLTLLASQTLNCSLPTIHNSLMVSYNSNNLTLPTEATTPITLQLKTIASGSTFNLTYIQVIGLAKTNYDIFAKHKNDICRKFEHVLIQLFNSLKRSLSLIENLTQILHHFDYSPEVHANGYRTLILSHGHACLRTLEILKQVKAKHIARLHRRIHSLKLLQELKSWTKTLKVMEHMLSLAVGLVDCSDKHSLFTDFSQIPSNIELDYYKMVAYDSKHLFGRTCGFQFNRSMEILLTIILASFAAYYDTYNRSKTAAAASLATSSKYILFPEQRARKCAEILRNCDYLFCQSFWNLLEHDSIKKGSRYIAPNVTVSKYFQIGPEPIEINSIIVPPPTGPSSMQSKQLVNIKLLSHEIREGMDKLSLQRADLEGSPKIVLPMSDQLLMHVHGGGFIATSSATHEVYLKPWALGLEIPIVSVDYSLAPEYPFPRAIEECFYAYAWILQNASKLGWTGKTILFAGDSAGGNLITVVTIKAIEAGLRKPDAIVCFYTPFLLRYSMSPSRLMAMMDPLLNTNFLWRCVAAYAGIQCDGESHNDELSSTRVSTDNRFDEMQASNSKRLSPNQQVLDNKNKPPSKESSTIDLHHDRLTQIVGPRQLCILRKLSESKLLDHPHMSPLCVSDEILRQFPTTYLIPCARDPFIDDNIEFARRLRSLNVPHQMTIVDELPHGYLDFGSVARDVGENNARVIHMLQNIVRQSHSNDIADLTSALTITS